MPLTAEWKFRPGRTLLAEVPACFESWQPLGMTSDLVELASPLRLLTEPLEFVPEMKHPALEVGDHRVICRAALKCVANLDLERPLSEL